VPLVMLQHFRGNLDNWDPALTDAWTSPPPLAASAVPRTCCTSCSPRRRQAKRRHASSSAASWNATTAMPRRATPPPEARYAAIVEWGIPDHGALQWLTGIQSPTLALQGDNDLMIPTKPSQLLAGLIPKAQIRTYPDAAHGFLLQYPIEAAAAINEFLGAGDEL
jgi:pimeloyl-ACP methyl ester carboxylesterase